MNLILSLSTEARMVIAEIVALIGILIILFLYTNIKSKNIEDEQFYLYNVEKRKEKKKKLKLIPWLTLIIGIILITFQTIFSWKNITNINTTKIPSNNWQSTNQSLPESSNKIQNNKNQQNEIINSEQQPQINEQEEPQNNQQQTIEQKNKIKNEEQINKQKQTEEQKTTSNNKSYAYLTFDDGPSQITNQILDILKENNVKATFFIIHSGNYNKTTLQREVREGHTIGLHAYDHNYAIAYKDDNSYLDGIDRLRAKIKADTGVDSHYIRFPGGSSNTISKRYSKGIMSRITKIAKQRGYKYFDWNVDDDDAGSAKTSDDCYNNVIKELRPNRSNIVLMHDFGTNKKILGALPRIIDYCKKNGYIMLPINDNTPEIHHGISN